MDEKVLTYAEIQAIAAGNPDIKARIETANELAELNMLRREWGYERAKMREHLEKLPLQIEQKQDILAKTRDDKTNADKIAAMEELPFDNKRFHAEVIRAVANLKKGDDSEIAIGTVGGFSVFVKAEEEVRGLTLENYSSEIVPKIIVKGAMEYSCEAGREESHNNVSRLKTVFASIIPKREESVASEVTRLTDNLEQAQKQVHVPFEHEEKIKELEETLAELDARLSGVTQQEDVCADPEEEDLVETNVQKSEREKVYSADDNDYQAVPDDYDEPDPPAQSAVRKR